jgi:hypothetical protein
VEMLLPFEAAEDADDRLFITVPSFLRKYMGDALWEIYHVAGKMSTINLNQVNNCFKVEKCFPGIYCQNIQSSF